MLVQAFIAWPFVERLDAGVLVGLAGFNEAKAHTMFVPSDQGTRKIVPNRERHPRNLDARPESCPKITHVPYLYKYYIYFLTMYSFCIVYSLQVQEIRSYAQPVYKLGNLKMPFVT